jgi:histidyl-tRNA synthetase
LKLARQVRESDIDCEVYPSTAKVQKQMKYANDRSVQYVVLLGEEELKSDTLILKNMTSGEQETLNYESFIAKITTL